LPSNSYKRCQYSSPEGLECEIWYPSDSDSDQFCPIHVSSLQRAPVNGTNKEAFFAHRDRVVEPLIEATKEMSDVESLNYYDAHIAGIEVEIEKLKLEAMHARALRQGKLENLTDDERKERRKIQVRPKEKVAKKSTGKISSMSPEGMIQTMMKKYSLDEAGAKALLGLD